MEKAWTVAATASGMVNARIIAGRLEAEGIVTRLKYDVAGSLYAVTIDGLGAVELLVLQEEVEHAQAILSRTYDDFEGDS